MESFRKIIDNIKSEKGILRGAIFIVGYILSPLTWWNDLFVNIPLAYLIASFLTLFTGRQYFPELFASAYLFTNILGFLLMHISISWNKLGSRKLVIDVAVAALYTLAIYILAYIGIVAPP